MGSATSPPAASANFPTMKHIIALLALGFALVASAATPAPVVTVDLYGNVFLDGANTNSQIGDFARNNPALAPQVDGAVRDLVIAVRARIAADAKAAQDAAASKIAAISAAKAEEIAALKAEVAQLKAALAAAAK